jgi:hypothetical protein
MADAVPVPVQAAVVKQLAEHTREAIPHHLAHTNTHGHPPKHNNRTCTNERPLHAVSPRTEPLQYRTAPHRTILQYRTIPYCTAPHRTTPHHTTPYHTTPILHHKAPHRTAPYCANSEPYHTAPHRTNTAQQRTAPYYTITHQYRTNTAPYRTAPTRSCACIRKAATTDYSIQQRTGSVHIEPVTVRARSPTSSGVEAK